MRHAPVLTIGLGYDVVVVVYAQILHLVERRLLIPQIKTFLKSYQARLLRCTFPLSIMGWAFEKQGVTELDHVSTNRCGLIHGKERNQGLKYGTERVRLLQKGPA